MKTYQNWYQIIVDASELGQNGETVAVLRVPPELLLQRETYTDSTHSLWVEHVRMPDHQHIQRRHVLFYPRLDVRGLHSLHPFSEPRRQSCFRFRHELAKDAYLSTASEMIHIHLCEGSNDCMYAEYLGSGPVSTTVLKSLMARSRPKCALSWSGVTNGVGTTFSPILQ